MPDVRCSCGKTLRVPLRLTGKKVKCPQCATVIVVGADGAATVMSELRPSTRIMTLGGDDSDIGLRGDAGPIRFACLCGNELIARRGTEGQKLKCPSCGRTVKVPDESGLGGDASGGGASCPKCGAELPGGAFVCPGCNANLLTGHAAAAKCPRCSADLPIGAINCERCHLNLVTGQLELPPDPEEEQVAGMMQSLTTSFTAPIRGLGGALLAAGIAIGIILPPGWTGKILGFFVYSLLGFPCLRAAVNGESLGPKSKVFKAVSEEWVFPWLATLIAAIIVGTPLIVLGIVFRPPPVPGAPTGDVFPSLAANFITVLVTIGTGMVLPLVVMRAGGFGEIGQGADPFALRATAQAFPLETMMGILYLVAVCGVGFVVHLVTAATGAPAVWLGTAILYLGSMWGSFLGSTYRRRKGDMPGRPTTAPG